VPQTTCGDHVVGRKPGQRTVLLVGHMDTVFPTGTPAARPFRVEAGRARGPGVYDMKGGLVVMLFALRALAAHAPETWARLGLRVVFNADEETGSATSHDLIAAEARASQAACVLEPARPGGEYVSQRKGVGDFTLRVEGRASHAGTQPELGANAIADLAAKVSLLHGLTDLAAGLTVNVGLIRGGERPNVVPALAECEVDVRVTGQAQIDRFEAELRRIVATVHVSGTRASVEGRFAHLPMELTAGSRSLFDLLARATAEVGFETRHVATGGASDGNTTSRYVPTLDGLGPRGNFAHSPDEYVEVDSLPERAKALARFLELWVTA
jgi:glutamate carboxypeptidase